MNICHCDWFNKETDWPIAGQDKVRRENQTKDTGKKGRVMNCQPDMQRNRRFKMINELI